MANIETLDQGIGNAAGSPWSVSGNVSILGTTIISGGVVLGAPIPPGTNTIGSVNQGTSPWLVSGGIDIGAPLPPGTNSIGTVNIGNQPLFNQGVLGNNAYWSVSGQVSVTQTTSPWIISGGVSIGSPIPPGTNIIGKVSQDTSPWVVGGAAAAGSGSTGNPLPLGGQDHSGNQQFIILANGASTPGTVGIFTTSIQLWDTSGSTFRPVNTAASATDAMGGVNHTSVGSLSFNGTNYDRVRASNVFKTGSATSSGNTAIWTPANNKKFRLLGYNIEVTDNSNLSAGAVFTIKLYDANVAIGIAHATFVPTTAVTTTAGAALVTGNIDLGPTGYISSAANNALSVNLSATLSAGAVRLNCRGTEE